MQWGSCADTKLITILTGSILSFDAVCNGHDYTTKSYREKTVKQAREIVVY